MDRALHSEAVADLDAATLGWEGPPMALKPGEAVPPMAPTTEDMQTGGGGEGLGAGRRWADGRGGGGILVVRLDDTNMVR
jgi:hypothetical protein